MWEFRVFGSDGASRRAIDVTNIDKLGIKCCDLIKIDVESMEVNVLKGARQSVRAARPIVVAECNSLGHGWPVVEFAAEEGYSAYVLNVLAYNPDNFRGSRNNSFGSAREVGLVLIPTDQFRTVEEQLDQAKSCPPLIPISCIDDLALALLKKPQYKYEVMSKSKAASVLGGEFLATEIEVGQFRDTINSQQSKLPQRAEEIDRFHAERSKLIREASGLRDQVATLSSRMEELQAEHKAERSRLIPEASGLQHQVAAF